MAEQSEINPPGETEGKHAKGQSCPEDSEQSMGVPNPTASNSKSEKLKEIKASQSQS
jgi:hypothetical protein